MKNIMKNYRKLKPGEVIREWDLFSDHGDWVYDEAMAGQRYRPGYHGPVLRKVRPDPDHPGWRFGDAGELAPHFIDLYGVYQDMRGTAPLTADSETRLMVWPEDPRLAE